MKNTIFWKTSPPPQTGCFQWKFSIGKMVVQRVHFGYKNMFHCYWDIGLLYSLCEKHISILFIEMHFMLISLSPLCLDSLLAVFYELQVKYFHGSGQCSPDSAQFFCSHISAPRNLLPKAQQIRTMAPSGGTPDFSLYTCCELKWFWKALFNSLRVWTCAEYWIL